MKAFTEIVLVLVCIAFISFRSDDDVIIWSADRPLTWHDFKGKPEPRFAAATTSYDILKTVTKKGASSSEIKIAAVFFKKSSWKKVQWINDDVLAHEQKHFDIVELFARKLRKAVTLSKFKSHADLETKLNALYDSNDKEMDAYQDLYDEETDGSMNGDQQRAWQKKILKELKELDDYKSIAVTVSF